MNNLPRITKEGSNEDYNKVMEQLTLTDNTGLSSSRANSSRCIDGCSSEYPSSSSCGSRGSFESILSSENISKLSNSTNSNYFQYNPNGINSRTSPSFSRSPISEINSPPRFSPSTPDCEVPFELNGYETPIYNKSQFNYMPLPLPSNLGEDQMFHLCPPPMRRNHNSGNQPPPPNPLNPSFFDPTNRKKTIYTYCVFCKNNGEREDFFRNHTLKDEKGNVRCPVLQSYVCPICGATGLSSHTVKYCPENKTKMIESFVMANRPPMGYEGTTPPPSPASGNLYYTWSKESESHNSAWTGSGLRRVAHNQNSQVPSPMYGEYINNTFRQQQQRGRGVGRKISGCGINLTHENRSIY